MEDGEPEEPLGRPCAGRTEVLREWRGGMPCHLDCGVRRCFPGRATISKLAEEKGRQWLAELRVRV